MEAKHPDMPHRCHAKGCRKFFSVKIGTCMDPSNLSCLDWLFGFFQAMANVKGVSSPELRRDLGKTRKTTWFVNHSLRRGMVRQTTGLTGNIEVDETYMGGTREHEPEAVSAALKMGRLPYHCAGWRPLQSPFGAACRHDIWLSVGNAHQDD